MNLMKKQIQLLKGAVVILALLTINSTAFADFVIKSGSTIKVTGTATVVSESNVVVESGGVLDNEGTVTLKGNFTNENTGLNDLGPGSFIMAGAAAQVVDGSGTSRFKDLKIDNSSGGVTFDGSAQVGGTLTMENGLVFLGTGDMTMEVAATLSPGSGAFGSSKMFVTDGTGEFIQNFPTGGPLTVSYDYYLGTIGSIAEYTPLKLVITDGDIAADSGSVGASVTNNKHPNNNSYVNYLNRYWSISQSGITSLNYDADATFLPGEFGVDGDVTGTEGNVRAALRSGTDWYVYDPISTSGHLEYTALDKVGDITGVEFQYIAGLKVFLQGAYRSVENDMKLDVNPYIPTTPQEAYSTYTGAGFNVPVTIPADAVDWILVEMRIAPTPRDASSATIAETVAGFLMKDGSIVATDGVSSLPFLTDISVPDQTYFVILHRNHLGVMSVDPLVIGSGKNIQYDYTQSVDRVWQSTSEPMIVIDTDPAVVYGLYAGETNGTATITNADKALIDQKMNISEYSTADNNFTGTISNADKTNIQFNMNRSEKVPY